MKRFLITFLFLLIVSPAWAESGSSSSGNDESAPGTKFEPPAAPVVEPGGAAKPADRQKSTAMAKAMALGGMAQSMIMCMQMQQEAQKQKDSTDKAMMMMMANQACQQAAEMGKAAAEADKGQKAVSQEDIPKQSQLKMSAQKMPEGSAKEDTSAMSGYKIINDEEATKAEPLPSGNAVLPDLGVGDEEKKTVAKVAAEATPEAEQKEIPDLGKSVPGVIPGERVSMNETDKNGFGGGMPMGPNLAGLGPNLAATGKSPAEEAKNLKGEAGSAEEARNTKGGAMETGDGGGGGGGGSSGGGGEKGNDPFEAMLAQLLGGPPGEEGGGGSGEDIVMAPRGEGKPPHIFEYASFRFGKLVDQKRLKNGKPPESLGSGGEKLAPETAERQPASSPKLSKR